MTTITIQQGDDVTFIGRLTDDSAQTLPLEGKIVVIDLVTPKHAIATRLSSENGSLTLQDDTLLGHYNSSITALLCGEYHIVGKVIERGTQVTSSDFGILYVKPSPTGVTR